MKNLILLSFVIISLTITQAHAIQITTTLKITQGTIGVNQLDFEIENTNYKFIYNSFSKNLRNGVYANTNLYQFNDNLKDYGEYRINLQLHSSDSIINLFHSFRFDPEIIRITIECLIGRDRLDKPFIKELIVNRISTSPKKIVLKLIDKPELGTSPRFEIYNGTKDTLYSATCNEFGKVCTPYFFGIINERHKPGGFAQYSPYNFCSQYDGPTIIKPKSKVIAFSTNKNDCEKFRIEKINEFQFEIYLSNKPSNNHMYKEFDSIILTRTKFRLSALFEVK